jgi:hypothetical protein
MGIEGVFLVVTGFFALIAITLMTLSNKFRKK